MPAVTHRDPLKVRAGQADDWDMTGHDLPEIVHLTQHWVLLHGAWYRDAWIRTDDGQLRMVAILDDLL